MSAIEVVVRPRPKALHPVEPSPLPAQFDVLVDGINITARLGEQQTVSVLSDLGHAVAALSRGKHDRTTLPLYVEDEAWEIGLEADGTDVLVSVYRVAPYPQVAVHERRVDLVALRAALVRALADARGKALTGRMGAALESAERLLAAPWPSYGRRPLESVRVPVAPRVAGFFGFSAELRLRRRPARRGPSTEVERADLHALLAAGSLAATARGRSMRLDNVHPFLVAERLTALAEDVLEASRAGRALFRRVSVGGVQLAVQRTPQGALSVTFAGRDASRDHEGVTLPEIPPASFVTSAARFARALAAAFLEADPEQARNLRLTALVSQAEQLESSLADLLAEDSLTNPEPDPYRAFGLARARPEPAIWDNGGKMRFLPRWVATVPGIDLAATFHCGPRMVIGAQRETLCLESGSGRVLWRVPGSSVGSVATPLGIARFYADGRLDLIELESGESRFSTRLRPRAAGGVSGALVHAPGLPRLLVLCEGDRSVTAVDLVTGEVRWRYSARRPVSYRMRRAGRLLLVAGGDSAVVALDVATGEVVWRVRDRLPFSGALAVDKDGAFALAGGPIGPCRLFHMDLWTGALRWSVELDERPVPGQVPLVTTQRVLVPVKDRRGAGVLAFDRETGKSVFRHEPGLLSPTTAWLGVDDLLLANSAAGVLICIEAESGGIRYTHVFARHVEADKPRRLEPVLRNGALFVPQHRVHVVRPRDGEILGCVPSDLVPDLVRVDDRCGVYIAEESGHVAAFAVAPKLVLVR
ncbi:MAG TPA: PQQ-binding-like beta-propeller repeat protein [Polyangiaceae bacterium]|nr:PQQ-binding-like beta-propeller repeat protein [Polyangiaceae bacterium]